MHDFDTTHEEPLQRADIGIAGIVEYGMQCKAAPDVGIVIVGLAIQHLDTPKHQLDE